MGYIGAPGAVPKDVGINAANAKRGAAKFAKPPYLGDEESKTKMPPREPRKHQALIVIPLFYIPVAFSGAPRGAGGLSGGVDINAHRPARKN